MDWPHLPEDKGLTAVQTFLRRKAREARDLFCSVCRIHPPKFPGGPCDTCFDELGVG